MGEAGLGGKPDYSILKIETTDYQRAGPTMAFMGKRKGKLLEDLGGNQMGCGIQRTLRVTWAALAGVHVGPDHTAPAPFSNGPS